MSDDEPEEDVPEFVLGMSSTSNIFRVLCITITTHYIFDSFMTLCILISCVAMTLERQSLEDSSTLSKALHSINLVLSIIFALECGLKIVTYNPVRYWRKHSNKIDAFIVLISFIIISVEDSGFSAFKSLRVLRALKAMRIATRSDGMKHLVSLIISSLSSIV